MEGRERYQYICYSSLMGFKEKIYEEIQEQYDSHILQADTDDVIEHEVRFFVWTRQMD